jgi:Ni,Fe-hydrogenase I cytochrome b subunit
MWVNCHLRDLFKGAVVFLEFAFGALLLFPFLFSSRFLIIADDSRLLLFLSHVNEQLWLSGAWKGVPKGGYPGYPLCFPCF